MQNDAPKDAGVSSGIFVLHKQLETDCFNVGRLPLCQVLMMNDRQYPWFILVPRRAGITEIYQLADEDQAALLHESSWFGQMIMSVFNGEKLNIGALGNVVPQLHLHHIVRNQYDASWPAPVWGNLPAKHYSVEDAAKRIGLIEARLQNYRPPHTEFDEFIIDDSDFEA